MKRSKRFFGFALSVALMCSLTTAFAAPASPAISNHTTESQLSEFAGDALLCQVVRVSDDGHTSSTMVRVEIPATATKLEEGALVQTAILGAANNTPMSASAKTTFDTISTKTNLSISQSFFTTVGSGTLTKAYATLVAQFDDITFYNSVPTMTVTFSNGSSSYDYDVVVNKTSNVLAIVRSTDGFAMGSGKRITIKATLDSGAIDVGVCTFLASQYDM